MAKEAKSIGTVTHYYTHLGVAIIKFSAPVEVGQTVRIKGATTDFSEKIGSMQYDHKPVEKAKKGQEVGIKVGDRVREGDELFLE